MNDYFVRALAFNNTVRIYAINGTQMVQKAQEIHQTWPSASAALGRSLVVGAMMGGMLKGEQKLTIRIKGDGPLGELLIDANAKGHVRGYVSNPEVHYQYPDGKLDVAKSVGTKGELQVIKDIGLKDYYASSVELISGELGEDFTYYFAKSEQTPSSVACGVIVNPDNTIKAAGGFIIQLLPDVKEETINQIEAIIGQLKPVSTMITEGYQPEDIVKEIVGEHDYEILSHQSVSFVCNCDKERFAKGLISIGEADLQTLIEEDGQAEVMCHFCNTNYHFSKTELNLLLEEAIKK